MKEVQFTSFFSIKFSCSLKNVQSGVRYAITQWEGHHNEILIEFKRMRLSEDPDTDERILQTQLVIEKLINKVCFQESKYYHLSEK